MSTVHGPAAWAGLRLSDRDRARARKRLAREHRRGRIDAGELDERLDAVASARTRGDLGAVFADLLPVVAVQHLARRHGFRRGRLAFPLLPLLVIAIIVAATGHLPWLAVGIVAAVLVVSAPFRFAHRLHQRARWSHGARWAC
ncbi:MAG TPA: DUF1707 domain-containing protein [Marmoricola sp.]|jgi:hypothetical protein|nr:DUF1707 domain-containing protein [Marmoricola sp.]